MSALDVSHVLADADFLDHAGRLLHHRALDRLLDLDAALAQALQVGGARRAVDRAPFDARALFAQVDRLVHRLFDHAGIDAHATRP